MFTGIVEGTGTIRDVTETADGRRLRVDAPFSGLEYGASVSVSGACLTVEEAGAGWFDVFLAAETVAKTYLGELVPGDPVNVERAMPADGRFDGHIVQGHVDTVTEVVDVRPVGEDWEYEFALPPAHARYVVEKGSIALDGISLTVAALDEASFAVAIIPTTYNETTLSGKEPGDPIHVEVDVIAKYVERLLS